MKLPEHIAGSFLLAQLGVQQAYGPWGTALMVVAGCLPDLDGVAIVAGWRFYRKYHRIVGHGVPLTVVGPLLLACIGCVLASLGSFVPLWLWLQLALMLHLFTDICFYDWPVRLLWPFSSRGWAIGLLDWNDLMPTLTLYAGVAAAVAFPGVAAAVSAAALAILAGYLGWRAWRPRPTAGWRGWLAGAWAHRSARVWRWLTGDFVT